MNKAKTSALSSYNRTFRILMFLEQACLPNLLSDMDPFVVLLHKAMASFRKRIFIN